MPAETVTMAEREVLEGYVVDIACVRKYRRDELLEKARRHSRDCVLMGHCVESGYAIVGRGAALALLDDIATPMVVTTVARSTRDAGIELRIERERRDGTMKTVAVREITGDADSR